MTAHRGLTCDASNRRRLDTQPSYSYRTPMKGLALMFTPGTHRRLKVGPVGGEPCCRAQYGVAAHQGQRPLSRKLSSVLYGIGTPKRHVPVLAGTAGCCESAHPPKTKRPLSKEKAAERFACCTHMASFSFLHISYRFTRVRPWPDTCRSLDAVAERVQHILLNKIGKDSSTHREGMRPIQTPQSESTRTNGWRRWHE